MQVSQLVAEFKTNVTYEIGDPISIDFSLSNRSDQDIMVLKWMSPLEGLSSDCLRIIDDGAVPGREVPYDGVLAKRGQPAPDDYIRIPAKGSVTVQIDLANAYPIERPGTYRVELRGPLADVFAIVPSVSDIAEIVPDRSLEPIHIVATTEVAVTEGAVRVRTVGERARDSERESEGGKESEWFQAETLALKPPRLVGGTASQRKQASDAHTDGFALVTSSVSSLGGTPGPRYKTWFGVVDSGRLRTVRGTFKTIRQSMESKTYTYDLTGKGCQPSWYAYTYKGSSTVWFCKQFWSAPANGTNSRAGTVVHELSHAAAGTSDHAYGTANCKKLAKSDPAKAVDNADSYEYYAEKASKRSADVTSGARAVALGAAFEHAAKLQSRLSSVLVSGGGAEDAEFVYPIGTGLVVQSEPPITLDDLPYSVTRAHDLQVSVAAELNIPVIGSVSGSTNRRVLVLERSSYMVQDDMETGIEIYIGYAIRFCVTVNKKEFRGKLSLPMVTAAAQIGSVEAAWMLQVAGLAGGAVDRISMPPTELSTETFVVAKQSLAGLIEAVRDSTTKFIPVSVGFRKTQN